MHRFACFQSQLRMANQATPKNLLLPLPASMPVTPAACDHLPPLPSAGTHLHVVSPVVQSALPYKQLALARWLTIDLHAVAIWVAVPNILRQAGQAHSPRISGNNQHVLLP